MPLYLHRRDGGGLALGHPAQLLPRLLPGRFRPDPLVNASWVEPPSSFPYGRTFVEGCRSFLEGVTPSCSPARAPETGATGIPAPISVLSRESSPEHPRELRRILIDTLSRDLDPGGRNLLLLSGGVDSSALGALTVGIARPSPFVLVDAPGFRAGPLDELSYIDPLVASFGIEPAHKRELSEENHRRWIDEAPGLPFQILHPALCDLPKVCAEHEVRVLMSGMFADEICGDCQRMQRLGAAYLPPFAPLR